MITTSKKINLSQLDKELGNQGLCADFNNPQQKVVMPASGSSVTKIELENAIKAHIAQPDEMAVHQLNREQGLAKLKQLGFTDEQIAALLNA